MESGWRSGGAVGVFGEESGFGFGADGRCNVQGWREEREDRRPVEVVAGEGVVNEVGDALAAFFGVESVFWRSELGEKGEAGLEDWEGKGVDVLEHELDEVQERFCDEIVDTSWIELVEKQDFKVMSSLGSWVVVEGVVED